MLWIKEVFGFRRTVTTPKKHCNNRASFDKSSSAQSLTLNIITNFKERQRFFSFGRYSTSENQLFSVKQGLVS